MAKVIITLEDVEEEGTNIAMHVEFDPIPIPKELTTAQNLASYIIRFIKKEPDTENFRQIRHEEIENFSMEDIKHDAIREKLKASDSELKIWTVCKHPSDYPDKFTARCTTLYREGHLKTEATPILRDTLEEIREALPKGLTRMDRSKTDNPVIVETWF